MTAKLKPEKSADDYKFSTFAKNGKNCYDQAK